MPMGRGTGESGWEGGCLWGGKRVSLAGRDDAYGEGNGRVWLGGMMPMGRETGESGWEG